VEVSISPRLWRNPASAPKPQPLDTVRVFSRYDFEPAPEVWIGGEVREPGKYRTSGQAHLRDAVYLAGGVTQDASLDSVQLFRTQPDGNMKILSVDLHEALAEIQCTTFFSSPATVC